MVFMTFLTLVIAGFTACAEFSSYALVHPVIRSLSQEQHIGFEKGLLKTYGRIMPILMPVSVIVTLLYSLQSFELDTYIRVIRFTAAALFIMATVTTILVNVPINKEIQEWDVKNPPIDWHDKRKRWMRYQAIRSWLLLIGFVILCLSAAID